jgi:GTP-binding protein EngB required for normal cell division
MDLSKCKCSGKSKDGKITFYIYSEEERVEDKHNQTYQYNYDHLSEYEKRDAKILLFVGKTGDGKSTAINAFFNLIKGVKLEDNYRLYLIHEEAKKKGESMTDGLHLYFLRDYEQKPIIIIDSQGFGDTRGISKDKDLNKAFEYVFSNIIDHINAVCFIAKATEARMPVETKYIISCITSLFSEDVIQNMFILATHPDDFTFEDGPKFIESIEGDNNFSRIIKNMREQFWYTFDSLYILKLYEFFILISSLSWVSYISCNFLAYSS